MVPQISFSLDGVGYKDLGEVAKFIYIAGVLDGWHNIYELSKYRFKKEAAAPSSVEQVPIHIQNCLDERYMQPQQIKAIIDRYWKDHPNEWHDRMSWIALHSLQEACNE